MLAFSHKIGYNSIVVTHRQTMMPEVASEKGRFFGGVCPIHETGRQSRYNIFLLCTNNLCHMCGENAHIFGKMRLMMCDQRKNAAKIDYVQPENPKDFGFYFRGVWKHPEMCTIFSMALSCRLQH